MAFTNGASRAVQWMPVEMSRLLHHLLGVPDDVIRTDVPQRPEIWGDICGWYYLPGPLTDVRLRTIAGAGVEVFVRRGQLVLRFLTPIPALYRGFPLHPADDTDPYVFRMDLSEFGLGPSQSSSAATRNGNNGSPLRCHAGLRVQEDSGHEPEAVGRRGTRPLNHGDPQPQTPSHDGRGPSSGGSLGVSACSAFGRDRCRHQDHRNVRGTSCLPRTCTARRPTRAPVNAVELRMHRLREGPGPRSSRPGRCCRGPGDVARSAPS